MFTQNQKGICAAIPYFATLYYTINGRKSIRKPKKFPSSFMPAKKRQNPGENGKYLFTKNFKCVNMYVVKIGPWTPQRKASPGGKLSSEARLMRKAGGDLMVCWNV